MDKWGCLDGGRSHQWVFDGKNLCEHGVRSSQQVSDQEIWTLTSVLTPSVHWENHCPPSEQVLILEQQMIWPLLYGTPDSFITSFSVDNTGASAQSQSNGHSH